MTAEFSNSLVNGLVEIPTQRTGSAEQRTLQTLSSVNPPQLNFDAWRKHGVPDTAHLVRDVTVTYRLTVLAIDVVVVLLATACASTARFGFEQARLAARTSQLAAPYWAVVAATSVVWVLCLALAGCWSQRLPAEGPVEFRKLAVASCSVFAVTVSVDYLFQLQIARGFLLVAIPMALLCMAISRLTCRKLMRRAWARGRGVTNILVVGGQMSAMLLANQFQRSRHHGYRVSGLCVPGGSAEDQLAMGADRCLPPKLAGIPVVGDLHEVVAAITRSGASVVAVAPTDGFGPREVRDLSWSLEGSGIRLVLAPALDDVAQPRLRLRPISGLPLMHVEEVRLRGPKLFVKTLVDVALSAMALVLLSPVFIVIAAFIKLGDGGPVFFRQERVGMGGQPFRMWKFRSMVIDAELMMDELGHASEGNQVLFKMKNDPRITKVGRLLRRTSLDELPQLLNVLMGTMSLVGPRPPLLREVEQYSSEVYRKLLVRPGMTGLWQVSGRSQIEWDESVRLDLYYVENWSLVTDFIILLQTVKAMVSRDGAY